jgi:hypothetical protein
VQHVAGLELEPLDLLLRAVARDHAEARRQVAMELDDAVAGAAQHVDVVIQREVVQDRVVRRDRRVVRQARAGQVDARLVLQLAVGVDDVIGEVRLEVAVVVVDQLTGARIALRVRIQRAIDRAAERFVGDCVERQWIE